MSGDGSPVTETASVVIKGNRFVAVLLILFALATTASVLTQSATVMVRGRVVDTSSGQPLANVRLSTVSNELDAAVTTTDATGTFSIDVPIDNQVLNVIKAGFGRQQVRATATGTPMEIALVQGAALNGRVVDEVGEPIAGAIVTVETSADANRAVARAVTDDTGRYRLGSLAPGEYVLQTSATGPLSLIRVSDVEVATSGPSTIRVFFPGASARDAAERLRFAPGETRSLSDLVVGGAISVQAATLASGRSRDGQPERGNARLPGRVRGPSGAAVPFVQLVLDPAVSGPSVAHQTRADMSGNFEFKDVPAGRYRLFAVKDGFTIVGTGVNRSGQGATLVTMVDLGDGDVHETIDVVMQPLGALAGRVLDEYGEPVEGAAVRAYQVRYTNGRRRLEAAGAGRVTDDLGGYRLWALPAGRYYVGVTAGRTSADTPGFDRAFFPSVTEPAFAQAVDVGDSREVVGIDVALVHVRTRRVSGRLLGADGTATTGGQVSLVPVPSSDSAVLDVARGAAILDDGRFTFGSVSPGRYVIQVGQRRQNPWTEGEFGTLNVNVTDSDVSGLLVRTTRGTRLVGRVSFNARGIARPTPGAIEIAAVPCVPELSPSQVASLHILPDWSFEAAGITGARRLLPLRMPPGWTLEDVRARGVSALDAPIDFSAGDASVVDIEIVLSDRASRVDGRVLTARNQPVSQARVVVFSSDRRRWYDRSRFMASAVTDAEGRFSIEGLPFDTYYAATMDADVDGDENAWRDPSVLSTLVTAAQSVIVRDGERLTIDFRQR